MSQGEATRHNGVGACGIEEGTVSGDGIGGTFLVDLPITQRPYRIETELSSGEITLYSFIRTTFIHVYQWAPPFGHLDDGTRGRTESECFGGDLFVDQCVGEGWAPAQVSDRRLAFDAYVIPYAQKPLVDGEDFEGLETYEHWNWFVDFEADGEVHYRILAVDVPEPGTWALMIAGFGLAGAALRRRAVA